MSPTTTAAAYGSTTPTRRKVALDLVAVRARMQETHDTGVNLTYQWRRQQLLALRRLLDTHWEAFLDALQQDLGKERTEAACSELWIVRNEIDFCLKHLKRWMRVRHVPAPAVAMPSFQRLEARPKLGPACLIIGPFNYPVQLTLSPLVGALAAGNPAVVKPSELSPRVAQLLEDVVPLFFEASVVQIIKGAIPETTALLRHSWGLIFFTGSARVGQIVATAAAATHTPVVLELGGKSPCVVDVSAPRDLQLVANRIAWAKWFNAGQVCIAVDYLLVHESLVDRLVDCLVRTTKWQFGDDPRAPGSQWGEMATAAHAQRLQDMIAEVEGGDDPTCRVVLGSAASCDPAARHVGPTIVLNPPATARLLREEVFGPILPIVTYRHRAEAVARIRAMADTPLCLYVFTTQDKVLREFMDQCRAGAVVQNDAVIHGGSPYLPFGGIGTSGNGAYHGKYSFDTFSHELPVVTRPGWTGSDVGMARYHPFGPAKEFLVSSIMMRLPAVPVLHTRWLVTVGVLYATKAWWLPLWSSFAWTRALQASTASLLQAAADWLREENN